MKPVIIDTAEPTDYNDQDYYTWVLNSDLSAINCYGGGGCDNCALFTGIFVTRLQ